MPTTQLATAAAIPKLNPTLSPAKTTIGRHIHRRQHHQPPPQLTTTLQPQNSKTKTSATTISSRRNHLLLFTHITKHLSSTTFQIHLPLPPPQANLHPLHIPLPTINHDRRPLTASITSLLPQSQTAASPSTPKAATAHSCQKPRITLPSIDSTTATRPHTSTNTESHLQKNTEKTNTPEPPRPPTADRNNRWIHQPPAQQKPAPKGETNATERGTPSCQNTTDTLLAVRQNRNHLK